MTNVMPPAPPQQGPPPGWGQPGFQPQPQAKRPWFKKKRFIIPLVLLVLIILASALSSGGDTTNTANTAADQPVVDAPAAEQPAAEAPAPAEPATPDYPGKLKDDKVAEPGGEIMLSGWSVTASPLSRVEAPFGGDNLCSNVSMTNRDDEQQEYNGLSWKLQTPNGNVQDMTFTGDNDLTTGGLAPGGNVSKTVCFEDQAAGPGVYILSWQPDIFSSKARGVWLNTL